MLQMENMFVSKSDVLTFLLLPSKMAWLCVVFIVRKIWKGRNNYGELSHKEWLKFSMIPLLTVASMMLMFFCSSAEAKVQTAYLFLSVVLIFINILVIELMQGILEKEELLRESALAGQKKENQIAHYRDMQAVYERQGRKMHDYKNQMADGAGIKEMISGEFKRLASKAGSRQTAFTDVNKKPQGTDVPQKLMALAQAWKDAYKVSGSKEGGMEKVLSMLDGMFGIKNEA